MLRLVAHGAALKCDQGSTKCSLIVIRPEYVVDGHPIANVKDNQVGANITTFGMCRSMANPAVQAATAAAMGALTPAPCVPPSLSPWAPGAQYIFQDVGGAPVAALTSDSMCTCPYAGMVTIEDPNTDLNVE